MLYIKDGTFSMTQQWNECGALIKEMRLKQKMTQPDLAKELAKSASLISRWEKGERRPKQASLLEMSIIFGEPIQVLQKKAGYTPEFDWYASFTKHEEDGRDILLKATNAEKEELRRYLLYIRFRATIYRRKQSTNQASTA